MNISLTNRLVKISTGFSLLLSLFCVSCGSSKIEELNGVPEMVFPAGQSVEDSVAQGLNDHRATKGLSPLKRNRALDHLARERAHNMLSKGELDHVNLDYLERTAIKQCQVGQIHENVMRGTRMEDANMASTIIYSWKKSKSHRFNVEIKGTDMGIGIARGADGSVYAVYLAGTRMGNYEGGSDRIKEMGGGTLYW